MEPRRLGHALIYALLAACAGAGEPPPRPGDAKPGVILHETHWQSQGAGVDTLRTFITAQRVLIEHAGGRTLLDLEQDRIVLLDPERRTYRAMSLRQWEETLEAAISAGRAAAARQGQTGGAPAAFEPVGDVIEVAGYDCDRYHHFGQRTLLGVEESVEQQIWVARDLPLPEGAYAAYQRALGSIESIGMGGLLRRPPGVILAVETLTRPASSDRTAPVQEERYTVHQVETALLPDSLFAIPSAYAPSDSSSARVPAGAAR